MRRVREENRSVYGARKVWKQLNREFILVGRWTVEKLMRKLGPEGVRRGRRCRTTIPSDQSEKPLARKFHRFVISAWIPIEQR